MTGTSPSRFASMFPETLIDVCIHMWFMLIMGHKITHAERQVLRGPVRMCRPQACYDVPDNMVPEAMLQATLPGSHHVGHAGASVLK